MFRRSETDMLRTDANTRLDEYSEFIGKHKQAEPKVCRGCGRLLSVMDSLNSHWCGVCYQMRNTYVDSIYRKKGRKAWK